MHYDVREYQLFLYYRNHDAGRIFEHLVLVWSLIDSAIGILRLDIPIV